MKRLNGAIFGVGFLALASSACGTRESQPVELTDAQKSTVCRSMIAHAMKRDPSTIRLMKIQGEIVRVQYGRNDGTTWTFECLVDPTFAKIRKVDDGPQEAWRERDDYFFSVRDGVISISYLDHATDHSERVPVAPD